MDSLNAKYRPIVEQLLMDYAEFLSDDDVQMELVFDRDCYLLVETGWHDGYRIYGSLLHLDIIDSKIWIQHDGIRYFITSPLRSQLEAIDYSSPRSGGQGNVLIYEK